MKVSKIFIAVSVIFISGCSVKEKMILDYEKSNPVKIEESARDLKVSDILPSSKKIDGTIAVRSIEDHIDSHIDFSVRYLIEDNLISNLLNNGYRVVERDPDVLDNLYREESKKYLKPKADDNKSPLIEKLDLDILTPDTYLISDGEKIDSGSACCGVSDDVFNYLIEDHKSLSSDEDELVSTGLSAADYILSYRVLECGVSYREIEDERGSGFQQVNDSFEGGEYERTARTRLHVRLTEAGSSEIVAAGLLEGKVEDVIKKEYATALRQIEHNYYFHTLPLMNTGDYTETDGYAKSTEAQNVEPAKQVKKTDAEKGNWLMYVGGALLVLLFGA
mgnify:CR=1 FL=1